MLFTVYTQQSFTTLGTPPIAAFTASLTTITAGGTVNFTDQSTNTPTSWSWNFGDGGTSTSQNPSHIYTNAGNYTVTLTASNSFGSDDETKTDYITVDSESGIIFNPNLTYGSVTDIDGNVYKTIQIGTQIWMAENLKTTKYNTGNTIPLVTDGTAWVNQTIPGYCWHNNDISNKAIYGALYNWYTVNTGNLCPTGWHVPTDPEWTTMRAFLGGPDLAGGKMKEIGTSHWTNPNAGATNESGFTALPGSHRSDLYNGTFGSIGDEGLWWSSTSWENNADYAYCFSLYYSNTVLKRFYPGKRAGTSIRCIKD